ncbi:hypothetical protein EST38_g8665 [Candolleomyces aberdarensis]|uniref:Uncharacterized protein n=1 Tax=Candolleomyces aberdarensis TaxID=2316362 RepID=A0A4Q2DEU4_9AGAR|nr:hypothetical protein EST38_g8665 [Candolleomyces aberdarensis]
MLFLARQAKATVTYQTAVQHRSDNPDTQNFRAKIDGCLKNNTALCNKMGELLGWAGDDFGWPSNLVFGVEVRETPGTIPDDIRGETGGDVDYLGAL